MRPVGPTQNFQVSANTVLTAKGTVLWTYTISNESASPVTIDFYDTAAADTANPVERVKVPANGVVSVYPNATLNNGCRIVCSLWTTVIASVRLIPR